jgi:hypothetical protein
MAQRNLDSFLPSGAIDQARFLAFGSRSSSSIASPVRIPRGVPTSISPPHATSRDSHQPYGFSSDRFEGRNPLSPPKTRSASADDPTVLLIEDWRAYTAKLRQQAENERTHIAADRARMEEVMVDERALWDRERATLRTRIQELEDELAAKEIVAGSHSSSGPNMFAGMRSCSNDSANSVTSIEYQGSPTLTGIQVSGLQPELASIESSVKSVPQESGRNEDGSPFYAPAPTNPSRTFDTESDELRIDSITTPRETPIRVTSHQLTQSDFIQSPDAAPSRDSGNIVPDSIDISHIQPELDGVPIKASAVSPTFVAKVFSPQTSISPSRQSPAEVPSSEERSNRAAEDHFENGLKNKPPNVIDVAENRRLTLHAGHTPNHSISRIEKIESGNITPTQAQHMQNPAATNDEYQAIDDNTFDDDPELQGPLGLTNDVPEDGDFLAALTEKLIEVSKSQPASPDEESLNNEERREEAKDGLGILPSSIPEHRDEDDVKSQSDDVPALRLRTTTNFGRPLGSL